MANDPKRTIRNSDASDIDQEYEPTSRELLRDFEAEMDVRDCSTLRIMAVTFNMGGICPKGTEVLDELLQKDNVEHDIYFIAT